MAAAAAAVAPAAISLELEAAKIAQAASREFLAWAKQPFFSDLKTVTRTWSQIDKNGKVHTLTETKTKGFSVSNGVVLGILVCFVGWEIGLALTKAIAGWFGGPANLMKDAIDVLAAPIVIAYAENNAIVGISRTAFGLPIIGSQLEAASPVLAAWDYLDGRGPINSAPPSSAVKLSTVPATAMAALSDLIRGIVSPLSSGAMKIGTAFSAKIQQATWGSDDSSES